LLTFTLSSQLFPRRYPLYLQHSPTRRPSDLAAARTIRCGTSMSISSSNVPARRRSSSAAAGADSRRSARSPAAADDDRLLAGTRSEEHTSELQSRFELVCRPLLEKKKLKSCI